MSCLDDRSKRPTAQKLLEHPFLQDLTSINNAHPCNVSENQSKVKLKKKLVLKNPMEDIPEEEANVNDEMEIKEQNHQQVYQNPDHTSTNNLQSLVSKPMKQEMKTES